MWLFEQFGSRVTSHLDLWFVKVIIRFVHITNNISHYKSHTINENEPKADVSISSLILLIIILGPGKIGCSLRSESATQNGLAICDFDMYFMYASTGQPYSMHDTSVLYHAVEADKDVFPHLQKVSSSLIFCVLHILYQMVALTCNWLVSCR